MVINSFHFLFFFILVFIAYWFVAKTYKAQNWILLIASYVFYGIADWKMCPLLLVSSAFFYGLGLLIEKNSFTNERRASLYTNVGVIAGIGLLLYFKYLNFFIDGFAVLLNGIGIKCYPVIFNIILPLGVSYFTFKNVSYIVEIHRRKIQAERDFVLVATFFSFFPTITAGPIDRPNTFLPQLLKTRFFNYELAGDGCKQILWGMMKKMLIADRLAIYVDSVWNGIDSISSPGLFVCALVFPICLYADFSGYSDMAIGVSKILGIRTAINFKYPFFSRNIAEYWRCWHMSLTTWLTDYVFMPLNVKFREWGSYGMCLAIIINMVLVGLWHGANWTFGVFGLYHGLLFVPLVFTGAFMKKKKMKTGAHDIPCIKDFCLMLFTYCLVAIGLLIFRAPSISVFESYVSSLFSNGLNGSWGTLDLLLLLAMLMSIVMFVFEWTKRKDEYALQSIMKSKNRIVRIAVYALLFVITYLLQAQSTTFIYANF